MGQRQLIAELEHRLAEQDAAHNARADELEAEVRQLEKDMLVPKTGKIKIPPADRDLGNPAPTEEELARHREEIARSGERARWREARCPRRRSHTRYRKMPGTARSATRTACPW
jgi:hypothetical protein